MASSAAKKHGSWFAGHFLRLLGSIAARNFSLLLEIKALASCALFLIFRTWCIVLSFVTKHRVAKACHGLWHVSGGISGISALTADDVVICCADGHSTAWERWIIPSSYMVLADTKRNALSVAAPCLWHVPLCLCTVLCSFLVVVFVSVVKAHFQLLYSLSRSCRFPEACVPLCVLLPGQGMKQGHREFQVYSQF